ncbi:putative quinol monooxygenase [Arthrobacter sp. NIO-1057]|uniref:putative quinol monooxygenase n=1 Tax=Arthrobacter sp. NIO-1057 TaxID=993071 RepID=UPI00071CF92D|nr:antibiotic biosynthesis monooxygenase family protein [Arthrobacter sp. NIO-1057]KSU66679.1 antibiotic biosynthesis monooxygenase [Arthrobacter sp. NIO-1057]SCC21004.1 Heme-degrading monooxygenase HmoA [Arthrobacter sp. NIO-1057]
MIYENAVITVRPGTEHDFEAAVKAARPLFQAAEGALSFSLSRRLENPLQYVLTVGWTSVDAHMIGFRESESYQQWRDLVSPYFDGAPEVHHTQHSYTGF